MASRFEFGAGEESRTLDLNLGKVALYQLSYSRVVFQPALLFLQALGKTSACCLFSEASIL